MLKVENIIEILNDLIIINNDRVVGYESAANEAKDLALRGLFEALARDSRKFSSELSLLIAQNGGNVATGTSTAGKIYRAWMDLKAKITKGDKVAVLNSCEEGERVAIEAYNNALSYKANLPAELADKIEGQKKMIVEGLHSVTKLRDTVYVNA